MIRIGVLGFQGSVYEHVKSLHQIDGVLPIVVKTENDLSQVDGIILPGGESTTIGKLLRDFGLLDVLKNKIEAGLPVWGTCAGMILLAKQIMNQDDIYLGVMNITVRRNAYGGQLESFITRGIIEEVSSNPLPMVFIRAPWIEDCGENVHVLAKVNEKIVAAKKDNIIVTSFHPEMTNDLSFHRYFVNLVKHTI